MRLSHLTLQDYRSYAQAQIPLSPGPNVLLGYNGVGKTNVVEAVGYLSTLASHRVSQDAPLVRHGAERAIIRAQAHRGSREALLEVEINPGRANRARINRGAAVRASDVLGVLRTVLFAPEDLELIKGSPNVRRRLLDDLAVQLRPAWGSVRLDYEKVLKQRNALLKSIRYEGFTATHESTLEVWDHQLAEAGARVLQARFEVLEALRPHVAEAYQQLSGSVRTAKMRYQSSLDEFAGEEMRQGTGQPGAAGREQLAEELRSGLGAARRQERERATTLVGPHRDDLHFSLDDVPVKGYASHGETWSYALALRLAGYRVMVDDDPSEGGRPVLILDDVFAELDARRRRRLAELAAEAEQLLITAAVDDDVPEALRAHAFRVESVDQLSRISPAEELNDASDAQPTDESR